VVRRTVIGELKYTHDRYNYDGRGTGEQRDQPPAARVGR
jgi:hypothetical protein